MEFAGKLDTHHDLLFVSELIERLTFVIVASNSYSRLRSVLMGQTKTMEYAETKEQLFFALFKTWSYNPVSTLTLCLLTKNYELAYRLMPRFTQIEMDTSKLIALGSLVQLIESPVFVNLRLELIRTDKHSQFLQKTLLQILMLMPLSKSFNSLKKRMQCISITNSNNVIEDSEEEYRRFFGDVY
jgi:vacuole morphology and inheritance protein 14